VESLIAKFISSPTGWSTRQVNAVSEVLSSIISRVAPFPGVTTESRYGGVPPDQVMSTGRHTTTDEADLQAHVGRKIVKGICDARRIDC
jgi:hypothetical protein